MKRTRKEEDVDALVARSMTDRGELIPTTVEEVLDTSVDEAGELPASLARLYADVDAPTVRDRPVAKTRERAPQKSAWRAVSYLGAFAAGIAAVWAGLLLKPPSNDIRRDVVGTPPTAPAGSNSAVRQDEVVTITKPGCEAECCGGAECSTAEPSVATCPTERTCITCSGLDDPDTLYRLRFGDVLSLSSTVPTDALDTMDVCVKVGAAGAATWSCEPARLPSSARPRGRFLHTASRAEDLSAGVAFELRSRDKTTSYGRWWSTIKPEAGPLCRGIRVVFRSDSKEDVGALSLFLERTYYVELARRDTAAELDTIARAFAFEGLAPQAIRASGRNVLALGPFDKPEADRLLEQIKDKSPKPLGEGVRIGHGDDHDAW